MCGALPVARPVVGNGVGLSAAVGATYTRVEGSSRAPYDVEPALEAGPVTSSVATADRVSGRSGRDLMWLGQGAAAESCRSRQVPSTS
jgi:hypothetical protein